MATAEPKISRTIPCPDCSQEGSMMILGRCPYCIGTKRVTLAKARLFLQHASDNVALWEHEIEREKREIRDRERWIEQERERMAKVTAEADKLGGLEPVKRAPKWIQTCPVCGTVWKYTRQPKPHSCGKCFKSFKLAEEAGKLLVIERVPD
jgi:hypothetical protein